MGLRVNTNISSMAAQRNMLAVTSRLQDNFSRLSSGMRISRAADDAAGLGISERMRSQIRSLGQAARNAQDGVSLAQTAEGALNEVNNNLSRMRELAIQSANGTLNSTDRVVIDAEVQALISEIGRIADTTEFNEIPLLNQSQSVLIQVGISQGETISIDLDDVTTGTSGLAIDTLNVTTVTAATTSISAIDGAINSVNQVRGELGATQNRMESSIRSIFNAREHLASAESRIRDLDIAEETADLTRNTIMQQAAVSVLSQANVQPQIALSLLQG